MPGFSCCQGLITAEKKRYPLPTPTTPSSTENETDCAQFATGGVSECRRGEVVLLNSVYSAAARCVRAPRGTQSDSAICVMLSSE